MSPALEMLLLWLVLQAAVTDIALRRIPNVLVLCGLLIAMALHLYMGAPGAWLDTGLAGLAAGFFLFWPLYMLGGMAAGDVKLMAMSGVFLGPELALQVALLTCLIGGALALLMLLLNGRWRILWRNLNVILRPMYWRALGIPVHAVPLARSDSAGGIPYGVAIALGTLAVVVNAHR
ncbi:prepilin peptidase [Massilia sp. METH4]|uniref:A24 family peptidase n=1 Tax=Massilia sp. METH4 TaxID=3123041 RepID=UPI0030CD8E3B